MASGNRNAVGIPDYENETPDSEFDDDVNEIVKNWEIVKNCLIDLVVVFRSCKNLENLEHFWRLMEALLLHSYHQGILKQVGNALFAD